jgi:DNA-binding response OmpR family regulator
MEKILCIDDKFENLEHYQKVFSEQFQLKCISNSLEAIDVIHEFNPDLILLDLYMPFKNGFEILEELRYTSEIPVIIISSSTEDKAIEQAFELGAIDFIGRQMSDLEICVRVKARLKSHKKEVKFLDYILDMSKNTIRHEDKEVDLTPNEYKVLFHAFTNNGLISKSDLYARAWPNQVFTDKTLNTHLTNLRKKLTGISSKVVIKRDGNVQFLKN